MESSDGDLVALPHDVIQNILSNDLDVGAVATARLVCKAWHAAVSGAAACVECAVPGADPAAAGRKLRRLHSMVPCLTHIKVRVSPDASSELLAVVLRSLEPFRALRSLDLGFSEVLELQEADVAAIGAMRRITALRLANVCVPSGLDLAPLAAGLTALRALSLVQTSKVAPLLNGDEALAVIGGMLSVEELELRGRMCGVGDEGMLALRGLPRLRKLAIGWVPWQSQVSQAAILDLLAALPDLQSLKLSGAELLIPAPAAPAGGAAGFGAGEGFEADDAAASDAASDDGAASVEDFEQGGLEAAVAEDGEPAQSLGTLAARGGPEAARQAVCSVLEGVADLQLRFNCCGTAVERTLAALPASLHARLTGLQWSYAKLAPCPVTLQLLTSCTNLRSLKIKLWYQDYHQPPVTFDIGALAPLGKLETFVIDKRPPFQQALPAQQAGMSVPITSDALQTLSKAWPNLSKLHLGLARADYKDGALSQLSRLGQLRKLTLNSYEASWTDAPCSVLLDVEWLPASLVSVNLLHVELRRAGQPINAAMQGAAPFSGPACRACSCGGGAVPGAPTATVTLGMVPGRLTVGGYCSPGSSPGASSLQADDIRSGNDSSSDDDSGSSSDDDTAAHSDTYGGRRCGSGAQLAATKRSVAASPFAAATTQAAAAGARASACGGAGARSMCGAGGTAALTAPAPAAATRGSITLQASASFIANLLPTALSGPGSMLVRQLSLLRGQGAEAAPPAADSGAGALFESEEELTSDDADAAEVVEAAPRAAGRPGLPLLRELAMKHCSLEGLGLQHLVTHPEALRVLELQEVSGLAQDGLSLLSRLSSLRRLSVAAPREEAWLGFAPLQLLTGLPGLRHVDWLPSDKIAPGQLRPEDLKALKSFGAGLHVLTLPAGLSKFEKVLPPRFASGGSGDDSSSSSACGCSGGDRKGGPLVRLVVPAYCEHMRPPRPSKLQQLLSVASDLIDRAAGTLVARGRSSAGGEGGGGAPLWMV